MCYRPNVLRRRRIVWKFQDADFFSRFSTFGENWSKTPIITWKHTLVDLKVNSETIKNRVIKSCLFSKSHFVPSSRNKTLVPALWNDTTQRRMLEIWKPKERSPMSRIGILKKDQLQLPLLPVNSYDTHDERVKEIDLLYSRHWLNIPDHEPRLELSAWKEVGMMTKRCS